MGSANVLNPLGFCFSSSAANGRSPPGGDRPRPERGTAVHKRAANALAQFDLLFVDNPARYAQGYTSLFPHAAWQLESVH
jgi:hypothetical protein